MRKLQVLGALAVSISLLTFLRSGDAKARVTSESPATATGVVSDTPASPQAGAVAPPLPPACNLTPAMPPSKNPAAFEKALYNFLFANCYKLLGWTQDKNLRDTGPYIGIPPLNNTGMAFGTHPAVTIYYSPQIMTWLNGGRKGRIEDGGIIVKEMHNPPASENNCIGGWTTMVRDSQGSWDGWYWSYAGTSPVSPPECFPLSQPTPDSTAQNNTAFPNSGFGNYCINCHASTDNSFSTFIDKRNIEGHEMTYLVVDPSMDDPTKERRRRDVHAIHAEAAEKPSPDQPAPLDKELLKFLGVGELVPPPLAPTFPGETWDHVVSGPAPQGAEQFITSDQCIGCHDATMNFSAPPNMVYPASGGDGIQPVANLSSYGEWRASMMGLAGRDPVFYAQLASERSIHNQDGLPVMIQNTCFSCHGVMGQRQLTIDSHGKTPFLADYVYEWQSAQPHAKYAALARDGVSCAACHHIAAQGLGTPATFTGKFNVGPANELNGPFDQPQVLPMNNALGLKPVEAKQMKSAALCGSCHTIFLPVFDNTGKQVGESHEQTTYLEWLNSVFQNEIPPFGSDVKTCQDCHMPSTFKMKGYKSQSLEYRIASIEDNTFPFVDNRAADKDITLQVRSPYARHTLIGANLFVLKMFEDFPATLGIRTTDPMATYPGPNSVISGLQLSQDSALALAREQTLKVEILSVTKTATTLDVTVKVTNLAGHFFPSGVSFRRAFIDFEVQGADRRPLWASGRTNQFGAIVEGITDKVLPTEFFERDAKGQQQYQPHYQKITSQSQVQIYEELMKSPPPESAFTTSFVALYQNVKENRLQPRGWSAKGPYADLTKPDPNTAGDPDYNNGSGADTITYSVPLSELGGAKPAVVTARVYYQTIPPYYLLQRFTDSKMPDTYRLMELVASLKVGGTQVANWKLEVAGARRSLQ
jgi:hypothetical protein